MLMVARWAGAAGIKPRPGFCIVSATARGLAASKGGHQRRDIEKKER